MTIPDDVLAEAESSPWIEVRKADARYRVPLVCDGRVVGFRTLKRIGDSVRIGPSYILQEFRNRGLASNHLASLQMSRVRLWAHVRDGNTTSERSLSRAGFRRFRRSRWGWFWEWKPC